MALGKVLVFGDSYSAFEGTVPAELNVHYGPDVHSEYGVRRVEDMWWHRLLGEGDRVVLNSSSSGTTICHTGYGGGDCSDSSFVARMEQLAMKGFFERNAIDTCFVCGGTNDSWANAPIGRLQYADWSRADLYAVVPAVGYLLHRLRQLMPATRIVVVINGDLKDEIMDGLATAAAHYGMEWVQLAHVHKVNGHPTKEGMVHMADQVAAML